MLQGTAPWLEVNARSYEGGQAASYKRQAASSKRKIIFDNMS